MVKVEGCWSVRFYCKSVPRRERGGENLPLLTVPCGPGIVVPSGEARRGIRNLKSPSHWVCPLRHPESQGLCEVKREVSGRVPGMQLCNFFFSQICLDVGTGDFCA